MKNLAQVSLSVLGCCLVVLVTTTEAKFPGSLKNLDYRLYPRRTEEEAAVLEWGHSAIISALDASVAHFGPQTSQAALLEVETQPILAIPLNGVFNETITSKATDGSTSSSDGETCSSSEGESCRSDEKVRPLYNADEVHGNMAVMTNTGEVSGVQMAKIAKASGAAALLIVNVDEARPDDIYRLPANEGADKVDIPVVMISLNSANVLTTASVTEGMDSTEVLNHGMPERVRLYAGGDRPFFEDIEPVEPTLYLIHNLLTSAECDAMVKRAELKVAPVTEDVLQLSVDTKKFHNVQRVMLWRGLLHTTTSKQIEDRIEQVTGFPSAHFSDFVVDRLDEGSYWEPHYDTNPNQIPMATITVFLTREGGEIIYPSSRDQPVKILSRKGMAVVHHNLNEKHELDRLSRHAMMPPGTGPVYVARKYVFASSVSKARRIALPLAAFPFGGRLPKPIVQLHDALIARFGLGQGALYFDRICVFFPILVLLAVAQAIVRAILKWIGWNQTPVTTDKHADEKTKENTKKKAKESSNESAAEKVNGKHIAKENAKKPNGNGKANENSKKLNKTEKLDQKEKTIEKTNSKPKKSNEKAKGKQDGKSKKSAKTGKE